MKIVNFSIILFFIFLTNCQLIPKEQQLEVEKKNDLSNLSYVIIPYDTTFKTDFGTDGTHRRTELNSDELIVAEKILSTAIKKYNSEQKARIEELNKLGSAYNFKPEDFDIKLTNYSRQYIPVLNEREEKEIWINFFCDPVKEHPYWKKDIVFVLDGGNCYFSLVINLCTMKYHKFYVNGEA
jgi:hypothetical protein